MNPNELITEIQTERTQGILTKNVLMDNKDEVIQIKV